VESPMGYRGVRHTVVRADARKREWSGCNAVGMRAVPRAPLNMLLGVMSSRFSRSNRGQRT
jgi:hypothetical protein